MYSFFQRIRLRSICIRGWLQFFAIPSISIVGIFFGILGVFLFFIGDQDQRLVVNYSNLKIAIPTALILWIFYSALLWVTVSFIFWSIFLLLTFLKKRYEKTEP